ncbi:MAG: hypothetical protein IKZ00_08085 [Bacteroidaceae bacterium]|nr:hypothetical protein [Bacteroidaceae bacterium]MBR5606912.1 hypothetical protein [Bacteroidaceae bacterium]
MERLTKPMIVPSTGETMGYERNPCVTETKIRNKLGAYEDLEEQGLLLRLPCRTGTEVYKIVNNTYACADCDNYSDFYGMDAVCSKADDFLDNPRYAEEPICEKQFLEVVVCKADLNFIFHNRESFGKTVFLTREEAEKALAEMG